MNLKVTEFIIFGALFAAVTIMGFVASRWKPGRTLDHLDEWGLGGRKFGSWVAWFLIGGDLYTAYTFVAVPALLYAAGAAGLSRRSILASARSLMTISDCALPTT